jgi:uncharacterized protein (DUF433 family)
VREGYCPCDHCSRIELLTDTAANDRIVVDPAVHHGKPVIRGTRMPVTMVVGSLAGGMTLKDIQRKYELTADDVRAAWRVSRQKKGGWSPVRGRGRD